MSRHHLNDDVVTIIRCFCCLCVSSTSESLCACSVCIGILLQAIVHIFALAQLHLKCRCWQFLYPRTPPWADGVRKSHLFYCVPPHVCMQVCMYVLTSCICRYTYPHSTSQPHVYSHTLHHILLRLNRLYPTNLWIACQKSLCTCDLIHGIACTFSHPTHLPRLRLIHV